MRPKLRSLLVVASAVAALASAALPAFADDHGRGHGHRYDGRAYEHGYGHKDGRARGYGHPGWARGGSSAWAYERGYRDGYRDGDDDDDDDWAKRRHYEPPPRAYHAPYQRREERIIYGSWFGDGYTRIVTTYYGRPCWSYSGWRGEWRRPYEVGYALPHGLGYGPVPPGLHRRLPPPPYGYSYVSLDGDLLLIADATRLVVDAILLGGRY